MTALASLVTAVWGLAWIALSMRRHARLLGAEGAGAAVRRRLRLGGGLLTASGGVLWSAAYDPAPALVAWGFCVVPCAGLLVALGLAFMPRTLSRVSGASLVT